MSIISNRFNTDYIGKYTYLHSKRPEDICIIVGFDYLADKYIIQQLTAFRFHAEDQKVAFLDEVFDHDTLSERLLANLDAIQSLLKHFTGPIETLPKGSSEIQNLYKTLRGLVEITRSINAIQSILDYKRRLCKCASTIDYNYHLAKAERGRRKVMRRLKHFYGSDYQDIASTILSLAKKFDTIDVLKSLRECEHRLQCILNTATACQMNLYYICD